MTRSYLWVGLNLTYGSAARYRMLILGERRRATSSGTVAATSGGSTGLRRAERGTDESYQGRLR